MNRALVTKSTGSWYQLRTLDTQEFLEARIRGKFKLLKNRLTNPLAVGDLVEYQLEEDGLAWITKIQPRRNYLIRRSVNLSKEAHIIASNLDLACILYTLHQPNTSLGFLDRFLVCCQAYSIQPLILFNKTDLYSEEDRKYAEALYFIYKNIGYDGIFISTKSGEGIEDLKNILKNGTSVFFGHSGAGKSSLVNTLQPSLNLRTESISEQHQKGKHTTTFAQMHFWDFGGQVIDTPGVREFALIDFNREEMQDFFPEIHHTSERCKYHNCLHLQEPHCAVIKEVENGNILESRYHNYIKLMEETIENIRR